MLIEEEIFQKTSIDFDKLESFGFQLKENEYFISKNILNDTFKIEVKIDKNNHIKCKIIDLNFNEEYVLYRLEVKNDFSYKVYNEFVNFLKQIKDSCTYMNFFFTPQANRISKLIYSKYNDLPDFPWPDLNDSGVFRNPKNNKWYGLIMTIKQNKIIANSLEKDVEIINLKLPKNEIPFLIKTTGIFPAYHMNKNNWVSIILDDTLNDDVIMEYIIKSHQFTENKKI